MFDDLPGTWSRLCAIMADACDRFKRGTSFYLGADEEDESEQAERPSPSSSPDKAQVSAFDDKKETDWKPVIVVDASM